MFKKGDKIKFEGKIGTFIGKDKTDRSNGCLIVRKDKEGWVWDKDYAKDYPGIKLKVGTVDCYWVEEADIKPVKPFENIKFMATKKKPKEVYLLQWDENDEDPVDEFASLDKAKERMQELIADGADMSSMKLYKAKLIGRPKIEFELFE